MDEKSPKPLSTVKPKFISPPLFTATKSIKESDVPIFWILAKAPFLKLILE